MRNIALIFVKKDIKRIFQYRKKQVNFALIHLTKDFGPIRLLNTLKIAKEVWMVLEKKILA